MINRRAFREARTAFRQKEWARALELYEAALPQVDEIIRSYAAARSELTPTSDFIPHVEPGELYLTLNKPEVGVWGITTKLVVVGWLPPTSNLGERIEIRVNDVLVAHTRAARTVEVPGSGGGLHFRKQIRHVLGYLGGGDKIEVHVNGNPLASWQGKHLYKAEWERTSYALDLFRFLRDGKTVNKYGKLQDIRTQDSLWFRTIFSLFNEVTGELKQSLNITLYAFYGTMLRAVRDGELSEQTNDFDTVYFSKHSDPTEVRREFMQVCAYLRKKITISI